MKRTLVISNACFSSSISNGRTLEGLFRKAEKDKLAQFFVYGQPDSEICDNYYQVTDSDALHSLWSSKKSGKVIKKQTVEQSTTGNKRAVGKKKTPVKVLMRELVWLFGRWNNKKLKKWINDFQPEIICLFVANNTFLNRLAIKVSKKYHIPIVIYSTEAYYFMDFNYLTNRPSVMYRLYYKWLRSSYKKLSKNVSCGFFNSTLLKDSYANEFPFPCHCIMNSSKINYLENYQLDSGRPVRVSYLGNLGLNRHKALIELALELQKINAEYKLDVYGTAPNEEIERELRQCTAIMFHGFVSYDKVTSIMHESSLLIHVEWNDEILTRDLKYAFSTKIADSICSGTPFLVYANRELAGTVFLKENNCAFLADSKSMLKEVLEQALHNEALRKNIVGNAKKVREEYFMGNDTFIQKFM